jgi:hypothetical protein
MSRISLTCEGCQRVHDLKKTKELPSHVFFMRCNFCPCCEDAATDYYHEWWDEDENDPDKPQPIPVGDNQLVMPFIFDELNIKTIEHETAQANI